METRRDFFRKAAMLTGGKTLAGALLPAIAKAAAISPPDESTFLDAEHIVILMQENRSFDHYFGTLRGVRGFDDPRAVRLSSGAPVWQQPHGAGHVAPFHPDANNLGLQFLEDLPHSWADTQKAWNKGQYDQWI